VEESLDGYNPPFLLRRRKLVLLVRSGRIIGVFFSPKNTFEDIVRKPSWMLPIVLLTVLSWRSASASINGSIGANL